VVVFSSELIYVTTAHCAVRRETTNASSWDDVTCEADSTVDVDMSKVDLPLTTSGDGEQVLRMFWLDASEDYFKQPGAYF